MKVDLTCPIEVTHTEVLSDDRGRCRGYLDIINICEHPIRRMEGIARWIGETGMELMQAEVVFEGMRLMPHTRAQLTVAGAIPAADNISFEATEVSFGDFSKTWSDEDSDIVEYDFSPEPPGPGRDKLRSIAGQDAICYPTMMGKDWLCVCGRLNSGASHTCARCMRGRERLFQALREGSRHSSFDVNLDRRKRFEARREEMRQQSARADNQRREKRITIIVGVGIILLIIAVLLMLGVFLGYVIF